MNAINKQLGFAVLALGLVGAGVASASATPIVMQFDHLGSTNQYVNEYYNGGCTLNLVGSPASPVCNGHNYGVEWQDAVGGGGSSPVVSNVPSPPGWMVFQPGNPGLMNVSAGFSTGFSFYYSERVQAGSLSLWSGENATGSLIGSPITLSVTDGSCNGVALYCSWQPFGVAFSGVAKSVSFTGLVDGVALFDNVTLGSATPITSVPEPADLGLFGLGLLLIGGFMGLRQRGGRRSNKEALS